MPFDSTLYRAVDPTMNSTIQEAQELAARLAALGLRPSEIYCIPQGDGKGWGITGDVSLADLFAEGAKPSDAVNLFFRFAGLPDGHNVQLVKTTVGEGGVLGLQRMHDNIWPNNPLQYLNHMMRIPNVFELVDAFLKGQIQFPAPTKGKGPAITFPGVKDAAEESAGTTSRKGRRG